MSVQWGGAIDVDGEDVSIDSPRFAEVLPVTHEMLTRMKADDDIANVVTALTTATLKLELELRNLRHDLETC